MNKQKEKEYRAFLKSAKVQNLLKALAALDPDANDKNLVSKAQDCLERLSPIEAALFELRFQGKPGMRHFTYLAARVGAFFLCELIDLFEIIESTERLKTQTGVKSWDEGRLAWQDWLQVKEVTRLVNDFQNTPVHKILQKQNRHLSPTAQ